MEGVLLRFFKSNIFPVIYIFYFSEKYYFSLDMYLICYNHLSSDKFLYFCRLDNNMIIIWIQINLLQKEI